MLRQQCKQKTFFSFFLWFWWTPQPPKNVSAISLSSHAAGFTLMSPPDAASLQFIDLWSQTLSLSLFPSLAYVTHHCHTLSRLDAVITTIPTGSHRHGSPSLSSLETQITCCHHCCRYGFVHLHYCAMVVHDNHGRHLFFPFLLETLIVLF